MRSKEKLFTPVNTQIFIDHIFQLYCQGDQEAINRELVRFEEMGIDTQKIMSAVEENYALLNRMLDRNRELIREIHGQYDAIEATLARINNTLDVFLGEATEHPHD